MDVLFNIGIENIIMITSAAVFLLLLIFAVDWRYFRDWVVVYLFKAVLDLTLGSAVVEAGLLSYPVRLLPGSFDTSIIFEIWIFPILCILYNQITRTRSLWPIVYYALLFGAGITIMEYSLEIYTDLIKYVSWKWYYSFLSLTVLFLASRLFIAFYRWGCRRFSHNYMY